METEFHSGLTMARGMVQIRKDQTPQIQVCNLGKDMVTINAGECMGQAHVASEEILNVSWHSNHLTTPSSNAENQFIGWDSDTDSLPPLIPLSEESDSPQTTAFWEMPEVTETELMT